MVPRVKGTHDFIDLTLHNFVLNQIIQHVHLYHFTQIQTPILEHLELFKRSLGLETDVVSKEMFYIKTKEGDSSICLRPEATAPTVRAFIEHGITQLPWKVFSYGPMFRYERPQKGRYRQFHQLNIEVIGSSAIGQDVQLIKMLDRLFHEKLKFNDYTLHLNFLGCFDDRKAFQLLLKEFLDGSEDLLCSLCKERKETNIMRIFDCKELNCQSVYKNAPALVDNLCKQCEQEWQQLQQELELLSVSFVYDPNLVRGLDYYNKTVFEFSSSALGAQNAFCGGGRYDQLIGQLGHKNDQPAIGAAIGMERLLLLLEPHKQNLLIPELPALQLIVPMEKEQETLALLLADEMQAYGLVTEIMFEGSVKSRMKKANRMGATYVLILGEDELQNKSVTIKNMVTGTQKTIPQTQLISYLQGSTK